MAQSAKLGRPTNKSRRTRERDEVVPDLSEHGFHQERHPSRTQAAPAFHAQHALASTRRERGAQHPHHALHIPAHVRSGNAQHAPPQPRKHAVPARVGAAPLRMAR